MCLLLLTWLTVVIYFISFDARNHPQQTRLLTHTLILCSKFGAEILNIWNIYVIYVCISGQGISTNLCIFMHDESILELQMGL